MNKTEQPEKKYVPGYMIAIISVFATLAACAGVYFIGMKNTNNYNYYNTNPYGYAETLDDYAAKNNKTADEVKKEMCLPDDMPGDTVYIMAYDYMPLSKMLEIMGEDFESFKATYGFQDDDSVTIETTVGEINKKIRDIREKN